MGGYELNRIVAIPKTVASFIVKATNPNSYACKYVWVRIAAQKSYCGGRD